MFLFTNKEEVIEIVAEFKRIRDELSHDRCMLIDFRISEHLQQFMLDNYDAVVNRFNERENRFVTSAMKVNALRLVEMDSPWGKDIQKIFKKLCKEIMFLKIRIFEIMHGYKTI